MSTSTEALYSTPTEAPNSTSTEALYSTSTQAPYSTSTGIPDYDLQVDGPVLFITLNNNKVTLGNLIACIVQLFTSAFVLLLNGLVLDTMVRQGKSQEPADLLVAGLALTDAIMGVFVLWATMYTLVYFQTVYECLARYGLAHAASMTGMLHLLLLTLDRFLKIVIPYRYNDICQKWTVWISMGSAWFVGLVLGYLPVFGWNGADRPREPGDLMCNYFSILVDDYLLLLMGVSLTIMVLMILLYLKLFLVARRHAAAISAMTVPGGDATQPSHVKRAADHVLRYTKTVLLIVGANSISWMPMAVVVILSASGTFGNISTARKGDFVVYASTVVYCNSLLNPLIYAVKIPAIRNRYRALFCRCLRRKNSIGDRQADGASRATGVNGDGRSMTLTTVA